MVWWLDRFGGMERHVAELGCALRLAGVHVRLVSHLPVRRANAYARQLRREGVVLLSPPAILWAANGVRHTITGRPRHHPLRSTAPDEELRLTASSWLDRWLATTLARECSGERPDIVHVHGCRLDLAWVTRWTEKRGLPSVYTEHVSLNDWGGPLEASGPDLVLSASVISAVSRDARDQLRSVLHGEREIALSPHIVRGEPAPRTSLGDFHLVCPARLKRYKGIDVLLRAFATVAPRHRQVRLVLAGDGEERSALEALARELSITDRVSFLGAVPPEHMSTLLAEAGALVLPSRTEGLPLAIVEGMACGLPIVATAVGGIPEVIRSGQNGLLVEPENPGQLAEALEVLLTDASLRERLGAAARKAFLESPHYHEAALAHLFDLYRSALAGNSAGTPAGVS